MPPKKTPKKLDSGSVGLATSDVIEIKPGQNLLGADLHPLAVSGDGWLSIANRSESSIFLHITLDSILLSLKDLSEPNETGGSQPEG
tara:strand:- start:674 stop:934 length:261 start_codon:yes stop_codon:yes gene_type:complete